MHLDRTQHRVLVTAEHGGHRGVRDGGGVGHRPAADTDEPDRVVHAEHAGDRAGREFADAVPGGDYPWLTVGVPVRP